MTTVLRDLETLWHEQPGNFELFISLADAYADELQWRELVELHNAAHARFGTHPEFGAGLVGRLRLIGELLDGDKERGEYLVALGDALWSYLRNRDEAMKAFQESYVIYPDDTTCLDHARAIYRQSGDFERVLLLFKLELKKKTEPHAKANVLTKVAQIYGDDMNNPQKAVEVLEQVIEHDPENSLAEEFFDIYSDGKTVRGVIDELIRDARTHRADHPARSAEQYVQAAHLEFSRYCGDPEIALQNVTEALNIDPKHEEGAELKRRVLQFLGRTEDETAVAVVGYVDVSAAPTEAPSEQDPEPAAQPEVHDFPSDAPTMMMSTLDFSQDRAPVAVAAEDIATTELHREPAAPEESHQESQVNEDQEEEEDNNDMGATRMLSAIERSQLSHVESPQQAPISEVPVGDLAALAAGLDKDPANPDLLLAFLEAGIEAGASDAIATRLEEGIKRLRKRDGELEVMVAYSNYLWKNRGDLDAAEFWFKRVKLLDAEHADMLAFYEAWFEKEQEWPKLFALLSSAQQHASDDERRREITHRLASLAENQMQSADKAINVWKAHLRQVGDDQDAKRELVRLYETHEKWSALVDAYKDELAETSDDTRRLELLNMMADVYQHRLSLEPMVIMTLQQVLELDPADHDAFTRLRGLLEHNRRFNDLTHLLAARADHATQAGDVATAVELYTDVATIWQDQLKNMTQALPYLEKIVEIDPTNQAIIARLKDVYEQRRDFKSLFELMRREASNFDGPERLERLKATLNLAHDRVRDPELIAPLLEEILEVDPENTSVIDQLETLLRRSHQPDRLANLLLLKAGQVEGAQAESLRAEAASLIADTDLDRAVGIWADILQENPQHPESFSALSQVLVAAQLWDDLQDIYARADRFDALWDLLDSAAGTSDDTETRAQLYRRMAEIAADKLDAPDRVVLSLEALREVSPDPDAIVRELVPWYEKIGDVDREIAMHRRLFEASDEAGAKYKEALKLRKLEVSRGMHGNAMQWGIEALRVDPASTEAFDAALESANQADTLELFVATVDDLAQTLDDNQAQEQIWSRLALIEWHSLDRLDDAIAHFDLVAERHPSDLEILSHLERLHALTGNGDKRIEILRRQIEILMDRGATQADVIDELSKIADVQRAELGQRDAARHTYSEILDIDPEHLASIRGIKELHREDQRWEDVVECLVRESSLNTSEGPDVQHATLLELGDVYRIHLHQPGEALRQYATVLASDPSNTQAVEAVESLLAMPEQAREAALLLEPIFRDANRPEQLIRALEARRNSTDDRFEEQEILDEIIPLYMEQGNTATAFERACRQVELDVERSEIWLRLEQLGARLNRWGDIEKIFSRFAPTDSTASATRFDMLRHLAAIREYQLNMKNEALQAWELLYEYDPMESAHVEALERLYRHLGRHEDLVRILVAKAELQEEPAARIKALSEAARIADDVLGDADRTIEILQQVLQVDNENQEAVAELRRLLAHTERFQDLAELLLSQAEMAADPEARRELYLDLARTRFARLDDVSGATEVLQLVLSENPDDHDALQLIDAFDETLADQPDSTQSRLELLAVAEPIVRASGNQSRLAQILSVRLEAEEDEFEKVQLLDELADLYSAIDQPEAAFEATSQAVLITPDDEERRLRLEVLGKQANRVADVVTVLAEAALNADPVASGDIYVRAATLLEMLGHDEEAIAIFEKALQINESDERALRALEHLYERHQQYDKLAATLKSLAVFSESDRVENLRRLATIREEILDQPEESLEAWTELAEIEPDALDALEAIERLHERAGRWLEVAETLERKASSILDPDVQLNAWLKLARVREQHLQDVPGAIETLNQILAAEPNHAFSVDALERLYEQEAQWNELCDILRIKLSRAHGEEATNALELKLASVNADQLFATDDALALYRSVLARTPGHPEAIEALERLSADESLLDNIAEDLIPFYAQTHRWQDLVDLYEKLLDRSMDPVVQATYAHEIAMVQRDGLEDAPAARKAFGRAWLMDLQNTELRNELIELVVRDHDWALLAGVYNDALLETQDPDATLDLHLRLAQLQHDHLNDVDAAERHLREALLIDESHRESYDDLERILGEQERWQDLADLLEARYNTFATSGDDEAVSILHRLARCQDEFLDDKISASDTYVRVLSIRPDDSESLTELNRLYRDQERWDDLTQMLVQQLGYANTEDHVRIRLELCELMEGPAQSPISALDYAREIIDLDPENDAVINILERLFKEDAVRADVAALLDPIYRRRADVDGLLRCLRALAEAAEEPAQRAAYLREVAGLLEEHKEDTQAAVQTYAEVFTLTPDDQSVRDALQRIATATNGWDDLAEAYSQTLRDNFEISDELRASLLLDQASIYESRLENLADAERTLEEVLLIQADHEGALDALERILSRTENWTALGDLYRRRADLVHEPQQKRQFLESLASLYEDVLEDVDGAIDVYNEIVAAEPDDRTARRALERLLHQSARWADLADLYRQQADFARDQDERLDYRFRLAQLLETELDQLDEALDIYRDILGSDPRHTESRRALEGLCRDLSTRDGDWREHRVQIIDLLLGAYDPQRDYERVLSFLEQKAQLSEDISTRVAIYTQLADSMETSSRQEERSQALTFLANAYQLDPHADDIRDRIDALAGQLNSWDRLIPIFLHGLELTDDPEAQLRLLRASAEILSGPMRDRESAIAVWHQALAVDPGYEHAMTQLERLYGELELWEPLVAILQKRVDAIYDQDAQERLLKRIATIQVDVLGDTRNGIETWNRLHELNPARLEYVQQLENLLEAESQFEALEALLRTKVNLVDDGTPRLTILRKLAHVQDEILRDVDGSIETWAQIRELEPNDTSAAAALVRLYEAAQRWPELLDALDAMKSHAADERAAANYELRTARVLMNHLDSPYDAIGHVRIVLDRFPALDDARAAMVSLVERIETRADAAATLENVYRTNEEWRELEALYQRMLELTEDPNQREELFLRLADVQKSEIGQPALAFMTYGRALREMPTSPAIRDNIEALSQTLGNQDELVAVYEDCLDMLADDAESRRALSERLGALYFDMDENDEAIRHFETVIELDEYNGNALDYLDKLYQMTRRFDALEGVLERELTIADPSRVNDVRFRLGYLREIVFERPEDGFELYRAIVVDEPTHVGALEALDRLAERESLRVDACALLEPIYESAGSWERLSRVLQLKLQGQDLPAERAITLEQLGVIELEKLGRADIAYAYLGRSLREEPNNVDAQARLENLAVQNGMYEEVVALYEEIIADLSDPIRIMDLALVAGRFAAENLGDLPGAIKLFQRVLQIDPENHTALDALENIARKQGDSLALARVLEKKADVLFEPDERFAVLVELGSVRSAREEFEDAIDAYQQALLIDESDTSVMRALVDLLEITEQYGTLVELLQRLVQYVDDEQRFQLFVRMGQYQRVLLKDPFSALDAYRAALDYRPDDHNVLQSLDELYTETENYDALREILLRRLQLATNANERLQLLVRNATLSYEKFSDVGRAIQDFEAAREIDANHPDVVAALDKLYRAERRWTDVIDLYNQVIDASAHNPARVCELRVTMADIYANHMGSADNAIAQLNAVLAYDPGHTGALSVLADLHEQRAEWPQVLDVLARQANAARTNEDKAASHLRRAQIFETQLADPANAATDYIRVIELFPTHETAMPALKALYQRLEAHDQLYSMLDFEASHLPENKRVPVYVEMAKLAHNKMGNATARVAALEKASALAPGDLTVVEPLLDAYISTNAFDRAEPLLAAIIQQLRDDRKLKDVVRFLHLQGKLAEQKGDLDAAFEAYEGAHKVDASYIPNLLSLGRLMYQRQDWDGALKMFQTLLLHQMNIDRDQDKVDVYYYLGMVRWHQGDPRRAKDMFGRALSIDPKHEPTKQALSQL